MWTITSSVLLRPSSDGKRPFYMFDFGRYSVSIATLRGYAQIGNQIDAIPNRRLLFLSSVYLRLINIFNDPILKKGPILTSEFEKSLESDRNQRPLLRHGHAPA